MIRTAMAVALLAFVGALSYAAAPIITAFEIREAVRRGDSERLRERVDWPGVRQSLKASMAETRKVIEDLVVAAGERRPGLWQRMKAAAMPYLADPLIDRYVTPEGVLQLYSWRQSVGGMAKGAVKAARLGGGSVADTDTEPTTFWARNADLLGRIEHWAFVSPTRLELAVRDRRETGRIWLAALEMQGLSWRLTEMRVGGGSAARPKGIASVFRKARAGL